MQPNILGGRKTLGCTVDSNKLVWEIMVQSDGDDDLLYLNFRVGIGVRSQNPISKV